jgi:hypothetical protein
VNRPRRRFRRLGVLSVLVICIALYVFRHSLRSGVAAFLVVDDPPAPSGAIVVVDGDDCYRRAAALHRINPSGPVLLIEARPDRTQTLGIVATSEAVGRRELQRHGVPAEAIGVLPGRARTDWERFRALVEWLAAHQGTEATILCARFTSRRRRSILMQLGGVEARARTHWCSLADRRFDESDWWRSNDGVVSIFQCYLGLANAWFVGEDRETWRDWTPDD